MTVNRMLARRMEIHRRIFKKPVSDIDRFKAVVRGAQMAMVCNEFEILDKLLGQAHRYAAIDTARYGALVTEASRAVKFKKYICAAEVLAIITDTIAEVEEANDGGTFN